MKINRRNRLMAIRRLPEFIKDYAAYNKLKRSESRLQKAYKIEKRFGEPVEAIIDAEKLHENASQKSVREVCSITKDPMRFFASREGERVIKHFAKGERLYLEVDISDTKKSLLREFKMVIDKYKNILPKDKSRKKETALDPWEIYDKRMRDNLFLSEIAQKKSGIKRRAFDNEKHKAYYASVKRAFDAAERMIAHVRSEIKE